MLRILPSINNLFYATPHLLQHFNFSNITCLEQLNTSVKLTAWMVGLKLIFNRSGNAPTQQHIVSDLVLFKCSIGHNNDALKIKECLKTNKRVEEALNMSNYLPCSFYLRYARFEANNPHSILFLSDWCLFHSHPIRFDQAGFSGNSRRTEKRDILYGL